MKEENKSDIKCENCKYYAPMFNACINESVYEVFTSKYGSCPLAEKKENQND